MAFLADIVNFNVPEGTEARALEGVSFLYEKQVLRELTLGAVVC